jgi:hypothetical protein
MKTNQMMEVKIGRNYTVQIGHLTQIGKLNDVLAIGNEYRKKKGLREIEMREWLAKESTWEFIIEVERKHGSFFQTPESGVCLSDYKNQHSKLEFSKLIDIFSVIKSQRGGKPENRGYWANLYIMLDLASFLNPVLKLEMYEVFINQNILLYRDIGGDNFKEFNKVVDTLPDRIGKNNTGIYSHLSLLLREKLSIFDTRGYNKKEHDSLIQQKRGEYLKTLTSMVEVGFVKDYDNLKEVLIKI